MRNTVTDEMRYKLLTLIQDNPSVSQRELASEMGVSVGKINYCIKALVDVGYIKLQNFAKSEKVLDPIEKIIDINRYRLLIMQK